MANASSPARHYCDHLDCGKSFRRAEHLTRHKLNHTNSTIPCPRCDHLFYRRDLLQRHLTLKHGKTSRANRRTNSVISPQLEVRPPVPYDKTPARPANGVQDIRQPNQFPPTPITSGTLAGAATVDDVLAISDDLFPFPPPHLDLAQDWGWLHQYPVSVLPAGNDAAGREGNSSIPDLALTDDWMSSSNSHDLYVSQEVYDFLVSLKPHKVAEAGCSFTTQDVGSALNAAVLFITDSIPFLHRPTLSFDLIQRQLCAAIFCVGLLIAPDSASHQVGCALLGQTRTELLQYADKNTVFLADLGILQAMLLVEFCGMYLADRTAMELSDIFHGTLVTLCRRLDLFEISDSNTYTSLVSANGGERHNPAEHESAKRLAYFVFALDVEHALLFGHERSILSVYSMKLELPSEEGGWQTACSLHGSEQGTAHRVKLHVLCRNLLSSAQGQLLIPQGLSQLSTFIIVLGLSSVVLDLLRRQQDPFLDINRAVSRLRSLLSALHSRLVAGPEGSAKTDGRAVYHITAIALNTPLDDLERAANDGFSRTGRTPKEQTRAAIIRLLTKHKVGAESARHAVHLLKLYLVPMSNPDVASDEDVVRHANSSALAEYSRYEPSALYFGALTLWAYVIGRESDDDGIDDNDITQLDKESHLPIENSSPSQASSSPSPAKTPIAAPLQAMEAGIQSGDNVACRRQWRTIVRHVTTVLSRRRNCNAKEYSRVLGSLSDNLNV